MGAFMKKLLLIFGLMAFLVSVPLSVVSDQDVVSCCLKGCG